MMQTIAIKDAKYYAVHGRTTARRDPLTLFWSASSLELMIKGRELWVEFESDYTIHEQWISVILNGDQIARFMLPKGREWIPIIRSLNPDRENHIEIVRDVQPMPYDPDCALHIHALKLDGELLPVPEKTMKLEVIGDSITSAEGAIGAKSERDWIAPFFCGARGYAFLAAQMLNADVRVLSQSGWGTYCSWDNVLDYALPKYYGEICSLMPGEKNEALGAHEPNDFEAWNADAVVINLGLNDNTAFSSQPWTDPKTGITYKQRSLPDGTHHPEDEAKLFHAMQDFLSTVRAHNPHAYILWVHGMLQNPLESFIRNMVDDYRQRTNDQRVEFMPLPNEPLDGFGARHHPGKPMHEFVAKLLAEKIRQVVPHTEK